MQFLFSKNMDPNLSKTVPGIPLRPLNHFLHIFQVWSILVKIVIFAIFDLQKFFHQTLKIDLEVSATFPGRFWKAQGPPNSDLKFGHFCNPNGNHAFFDQNVHIWSIIQFWVLKGVKNWNFVDAIFIFRKYGPSAFQNRSDHPSATPSHDFMISWSSTKMPKKGGD